MRCCHVVCHATAVVRTVQVACRTFRGEDIQERSGSEAVLLSAGAGASPA